MIGIIIVTHGNLALELKSAMEHILGIQKNIDIIYIKPEEDLEIKKEAEEERERLKVKLLRLESELKILLILLNLWSMIFHVWVILCMQKIPL